MPLKSKFEDIDIPNTDIPSFLFNRSPDFGENHPVLFDAHSGKYLTFGQVREASQRFGAGLQDRWNWKKNDVFCIFSPNQYDYTVVAWGVHFAAGIVTPSNPAYQVGELVHQLVSSNAKAIIALPQLLSVVTEAARKVGIPKDRIILFGDKKVEDFEPWKNLWTSRRANYPKDKIDPTRDVAFLAFSSGTTGLPKGVMLSHRNIIANTLQTIRVDEHNTTVKDRYMACLPLFHIYGLTTLAHVGIYQGIGLVVLQRFELALFCKAVQKYKVTYAHIVPPIVLLLAKDPSIKNYDLSSLRMINSGAAPLTKELVLEAHERLGIPVKQGYGLTETSPTTHAQKWDGVNGWRVYEVPAGKEGELWLRGPNVMLGYLNNPEANSRSFTKDGFFKTGDVGRVDTHGNYYITDRIKELIKYKGFQVAPAELEGLLLSHPKVGDAGVVGVYSSSVASELPLAFIVPAPGVSASDNLVKELVAFMNERVAPHKRLRGGIKFVQVIPKSPSGKILRRVLQFECLFRVNSKYTRNYILSLRLLQKSTNMPAGLVAQKAHLKAFQNLPTQLQYFFRRFPPNLGTNATHKYPPGSNPFKSSHNHTTKKWNEPIYSLRRQSDLHKLALQHNVADLLPTMRRQEIESKVMKGTIRWKGRKAVNTRDERKERVKKALVGQQSTIRSRNSLKSFMRGLRWRRDPF
ncbi:4-coumarate--CoA ligase-like 7 [Neolecta irregularis DAH-3]|uniref:4-coumarate--CoA ligase-like 7 n=1 Tax=Neolecta irregularis (strain DAH-3) TaxID=1198029 RepID=A0A1U7LVZ7_NEOID|nr:4-coumarate--CoA ligase-like 7 [Neolecta irregularis DAH-3]|eukprot:OLL26856.1 4-coumarate--CoA ligase-like 7 [Neolecta irregularis DAH-3]